MTSIPPPPPPPAPQPPAPGWYDDPTDSRQLRYWTGATWSAHVHLKARPKARGLGVVAAAWAVAITLTALAVSVAVDGSDTASPPPAAPSTSTTTEPPATSTTSTTTATTARPSSTTSTTTAGIDEATARELAMITLLEIRVNPQIGDSYRANRDGTVQVLGDMADSSCELAETAGGNRELFALGLTASWIQLEEETREFYGGTPEAWGTLNGVLLEWRCPDRYDELG